MRSLWHPALAGFTYFGVVFALGFALGTLRILVVKPRLGEGLAVGLELPIMLALSWFACRWLVARFALPATLRACLVMGALAFAMLMGAELMLSMLVFGRTVSAHLEQYRELAGLLGLAGQVAFALFPLIQGRGATSRPP